MMEDPVAVQADGTRGVHFAEAGSLPRREVDLAATQEASRRRGVAGEGQVAAQPRRRLEGVGFQVRPVMGFTGNLQD